MTTYKVNAIGNSPEAIIIKAPIGCATAGSTAAQPPSVGQIWPPAQPVR